MNDEAQSGVDSNESAPTSIQIIRSPRRKNTSSAEQVDGRIIVRLPTGLTPREEEAIVAKLVASLERQQRRRDLNASQTLAERAAELNRTYFAGRLRVASIEYVSNQQARFGSCTPSRGTIRISDRLAKMPAWVLDYVIIHELAHLLEANHSPRFWSLVNPYPLTERARGYLIAVGMGDVDE